MANTTWDLTVPQHESTELYNKMEEFVKMAKNLKNRNFHSVHFVKPVSSEEASIEVCEQRRTTWQMVVSITKMDIQLRERNRREISRSKRRRSELSSQLPQS